MNKPLAYKIIFSGLFFLALSPNHFLLAQEPFQPTQYKLLAPIPLSGPQDGPIGTTTGAQFIPGLFQLAIALATGLAVLMLIYGGFQYLSTDAWGEKSEAKGTIQNALVGLMLTLSAYIIIYTINPALLEFNLEIPSLEINGTILNPGTKPIPAGASCSDCVTLGVSGKTPAQNGCSGTGLCQVSAALNNQLIYLRDHQHESFYVTESWPPTIQHKDPCHNSGTCVDLTIPRTDAASIMNLIRNADASSLTAVYEVINQGRYNTLKNAGIPPGNLLVNSSANGEHFHVKLK